MAVKDIKCFLLDMDGTIYLGSKLIDGAELFLNRIKELDKKYIFLTNNSSKSRKEYIKKLAAFGIDASDEEIFTSGDATIEYLKEKKKDAVVFLLGTPALEEEFQRNGFTLVRERDKHVDFVVLGFDTTLTYEKLWIACDYIKEGVEYIATHGDLVCPLENNRTMPDAGAMISLIKDATGKLPKIMGKPEKPIINAIMKRYSLQPQDMAMVGDRLYTDIKLGEVSGITSILVYSGETTKEMYESSSIKADYQYSSVKEIAEDL